jgi:NADH:ubiquinone oxidoreductase subunit K
MLLCIELMFFSIAFIFIIVSLAIGNSVGQIYALLIITTTAAEMAIGLSLLVIASRINNKVTYGSLITLRG